ncbi:MAG: GGDEF domain-containing protein [Syntrophobacteraceae bacterium]|jgi:diguanylate cyclase (GGDEF)-like protein|nr:GGDEF domain-containing protein [Syntrophobacteraceae bacterium]
MKPQPIVEGSCPLGYGECPVLLEVQALRDECSRLTELSITDPLTGYFNYRYMLQALDQEMERSRRTGLPTGLIMVDLDRFKDVNDTYGHMVGDAALQWACSLWRENIRRIDIPCRYGGEEFAIILPGTDLPQATLLAERLRRVLADSPLQLGELTLELTASFGVSAFRGQTSATPQRVLDCADHMLIRAKAQGRNRVCSDLQPKRRSPTEVTLDERSALFNTQAREDFVSPCLDGLEDDCQ